MARNKGSANLAASLEVLAGAPLDARLVVNTVADLTASGSFPYFYDGMVVTVTANHKQYMLTGDPTVAANWKDTSSGGSIDSLDDISDVQLSTLADGEALVYDETDDKWENKAVVLSSEKGAASGVAELDANGKVPTSQLPSYVDDVIEGYYHEGHFYEDALYTTEIIGEAGKVYVDKETNLTYRWSGSAFVKISSDLALGETDATAYRGDRGKIAYDHSQTTSGNPHNVTATDVGLGNVDNTADLDKPISTATQTALDAKANTTDLATVATSGDYTDLSNTPDPIQVSTMPVASASNVGTILQFVGATDVYTNGYYYQCVSDGQDPASYSWVKKNVQDGAVYTAGTGIIIDQGVISVDTMSEGEMDDVVPDPPTPAEVELSDLADVSISTPDDGDVLKWDDTEGKWVNGAGGGSGGDASLELAVTSNLAVGAIASGTTLAQGTTFTEFVQKLLITEIAPTFTFSISKSGNVAYGGSYTETLTLACSSLGSAKKIKSIAWYEGSTLKQTDTIDSTSTGSWTYTMGTATTDTTTFKAIVVYTKSNDVDDSQTKTASINFYYNKFYGGVSDLNPTEATVEALTSALATAKGGTYSFTVTAGRICYAYPKNLGALTSIKDGNGFSLFDSFTRTEQSYTQNGSTVAYYRYVLTDATTVASYSVVFA